MTFGSIFMLYRQGITRSFFHQDDVVELGVVADWQGISTLGHMNNEHLNITFWPLLRAQWLLFGINYTPYLALNIILHLFVLALLFQITYKLTKSILWASLPVWGMVINANWFTVVWWITGQMFFLTTIFALISYWIVLKIQENSGSKLLYMLLYVFSILPGLSWGVGLTWPLWPLLIYGINYQTKKINMVGVALLAAQITLTIVYLFIAGNYINIGSNPVTWLSNPFKIISFLLVGVFNTVLGRWVWPYEHLKIRFIFLGVLMLILCIWRPIKKNFNNKDILFGMVVVLGSYATFTLPRWKLGLWQALANYYAYFPLPFILISASVLFSKVKLSKLQILIILGIFLIHIPMSWIGFESWASTWVIRPQQTRAYFSQLNSTTRGNCIDNVYIPEYIVPQNIWKIDYLWPIFKKDFDPICK